MSTSTRHQTALWSFFVLTNETSQGTDTNVYSMSNVFDSMTETDSTGHYLRISRFCSSLLRHAFCGSGKVYYFFSCPLERHTNIFCKLRKHFHQVDNMWASHAPSSTEEKECCFVKLCDSSLQCVLYFFGILSLVLSEHKG